MRIRIARYNFFKRFLYLLLDLFFFVSIAYVINMYSPYNNIALPFTSFALSAIDILYALLLFFCSFLMKTLTGHFIHGVSLGILIIGIMLLKVNNFFQISLIGLLVLLIFVLEFAFWPHKSAKK